VQALMPFPNDLITHILKQDPAGLEAIRLRRGGHAKSPTADWWLNRLSRSRVFPISKHYQPPPPPPPPPPPDDPPPLPPLELPGAVLEEETAVPIELPRLPAKSPIDARLRSVP